MRNKKLFFLILSFGIALLAYFPSIYQFDLLDLQKIAFQEEVLAKEEKALEYLEELSRLDRNQFLLSNTKKFHKKYEDEGFSFFIFHKNTLDFWSEDATIIDIDSFLTDSPFYASSNAWQRKHLLQKGDSIYAVLYLIKTNYQIQNRFLVNNFHSDFDYSNLKDISLEGSVENLIVGLDGQKLFYLETIDDNVTRLFEKIIAFLFLLSLIYIVSAIPSLIASSIFYQSLIIISLLIGFRSFLFFNLPPAWQYSDLFQSNWFAISTFIPSLGDLILHLISLSAFLYWLKKRLKHIKSVAISALFLIISCGFGWLSIELISESIASSQINFDLNNVFQLNALSLISYLSFILLFICTVLLIDVTLIILKNSATKKRGLLLLLVVLGLFLSIISWQKQISIIHTWHIPVFIIMWLYSYDSKNRMIRFSILVLVICSATLAYWSNVKIQGKKKSAARVILKKLAEEKDPVAEYLFDESQQKIRADAFLKKSIANYWENKEQIDKHLKEKYFNSYWKDYSILLSVCSSKDSLYNSKWGGSISCYDYFQNRIRLEGTAISSSNLFQLKNLAGRIDYIGEIPINVDSNTYRIYIELSSNYFNENEGYPELLLDGNNDTKNINLSDYDYAVYENGQLIFKNGNYNYSTSLKINELSANTFYDYETLGYHHTEYQKDGSITIILSYASSTTIDFFTSFAYLIVLFAFVFIFFVLSLVDFPFHMRPQWRDFSFKIQLFLIGSIFTALILVAIGSTYYIKKQYQIKNSNNLKEKLRSINLEMENKIGGEEILSNGLKSYVNGLLIDFSNVFYTDINFYHKNGELYSSSRPEIFKKGLKSEQMNPMAFLEISYSEKAEWVQNEKIGKMEYSSAYMPFRNYENQVLGYINLPYFVKQGKLQEEISNFIVSTINIYVGVFILALFISILLINQLSKPLLLIREKIARLKIGSSIELIEWKSEDEIGTLVKEYNRIAIELNESAELLAKSEREVAWREMAKQVAHEIKNPLTPMKLSIQHLQMATKQNPENLKERINRTTQILIEQIDSLSNIATAFSTFAKLPERKIERVDLIPILKNIVDLYSKNSNVHLKIEKNLGEAFVSADKDQLLRMMNNLLKNANQAIEQKSEPVVEVRLKKDAKNYILSIYDNGIGISEDDLKRVFEPNFTTKSSGTGLGLAMSKSMIEQMGGLIEVTSQKGRETTFTIQLPIA